MSPDLVKGIILVCVRGNVVAIFHGRKRALQWQHMQAVFGQFQFLLFLYYAYLLRHGLLFLSQLLFSV